MSLPLDLGRYAPLAVLAETSTPAEVKKDFLDMMVTGIDAYNTRGNQREIGPSEYGHACERFLAYKLAEVQSTGFAPVPWRQWVGTQVHKGMDVNAKYWNDRFGQRYLTNLLVNIGDLYPGRPIWGTLDILDVWRAAVLDLKVPGITQMRKLKGDAPDTLQYRAQKQGYAAGVVAAGYPVRWAGSIRISPAMELNQAISKVEPFDPHAAPYFLDRCGEIARNVEDKGVEAVKDYDTTDHYCNRCPFYRPAVAGRSTDLTQGCPGHQGGAHGVRTTETLEDFVEVA